MATSHIPVPAAQAALSLLSLSASLSSTPPPSHSNPSSPSAPALGRFVHTPRSSVTLVRPPAGSLGSHPAAGKRRPSSAAQTRRRTSDAASAASTVRAGAPDPSVPSAGPLTDSAELAPSGGGKAKKGTIFKCETCSKVYRHPNCLVKHRWEHSPHWREASKFLLSKHQQVQMLEAAAILSHISPAINGVGTSLPEDRSLWPAYLSGGLLPMPGIASAPAAPAPPVVAPVHSTSTSTYRDRETSVSTSAIDDEDNTAVISAESSDMDEDLEREDSGYGSSSAAPAAVAVPGYRPPPMYTAMSIGGHEYTLSSSHAACDAGAHMGSMAMGRSLQQSMFAASRSISASSFGLSSLRGARDDEADDEGEANDENNNTINSLGRPKWEEDESMAMDMDL